jgi:predicted enzyme related to lactoylglutathione lyase
MGFWWDGEVMIFCEGKEISMADKHGSFFWAELHLRGMEKAKVFYSKTLGWTYDTMPLAGGDGDYVIAKLDDKPVAGFLDMTLMHHLDEVPPHWLTYVAVDDVDAMVAEVEGAGGTLRRPVFDVPNVGRVAIVEDAAGAVLAMMTQA